MRSGGDMASLLDPHCPQKLLYTFYIIDWLGRPARLRRQSGLVSDSLRQADRPGASNNWPRGARPCGASGSRTASAPCSGSSSSSGSTQQSQGASTKSYTMVPILSLTKWPSVMVTLGLVFLHSKDGSSYRTGMFGRGQIVHFALSLLVS